MPSQAYSVRNYITKTIIDRISWAEEEAERELLVEDVL